MADRQGQIDAAKFANRALGKRLKKAGIKRDDLAERSRGTSRGSENWIQGLTGPQWHNVAHMLMDPTLRPVVMQAASDVVTGKSEDVTPAT